MSRQIQFRRGTAAEHRQFTGKIGEITVDTSNNTIRVHDGQTVGGTPLARADAVTDMSGTDYVIAWQAPTANNNYTWYRKYKSGWIEMGGRLAGKSITFPQTFAVAPTVTIATTETGVAVTASTVINNITTTGFAGFKTQVNADWHSGSTNMSGYWTAYGIAAA